MDIRYGERPFAILALLGVLRKHHAVALVIYVIGPVTAGKLLGDAAVTAVILI